MGEVLQTMLDVHADEIFRHGVFNGDPHPGNILLMPDGRLGLIDYGQVKRVPEHVRVAYAKLTLAILAEDKDEIARLCQSDPPEGSGGRADTRIRTWRIAWRCSGATGTRRTSRWDSTCRSSSTRWRREIRWCARPRTWS